MGLGTFLGHGAWSKVELRPLIAPSIGRQAPKTRPVRVTSAGLVRCQDLVVSAEDGFDVLEIGLQVGPGMPQPGLHVLAMVPDTLLEEPERILHVGSKCVAQEETTPGTRRHRASGSFRLERGSHRTGVTLARVQSVSDSKSSGLRLSMIGNKPSLQIMLLLQSRLPIRSLMGYHPLVESRAWLQGQEAGARNTSVPPRPPLHPLRVTACPR